MLSVILLSVTYYRIYCLPAASALCYRLKRWFFWDYLQELLDNAVLFRSWNLQGESWEDTWE
jgi:hypothetical protein